MKNKSSLSQVGQISIIIPLVIYFLFYALMVGLGIFFAKSYSASELGKITMYLKGGGFIIVFLSYFLAIVCKKSRWGFVGFGLLYAVACFLPSYAFGMRVTGGLGLFTLSMVLESSFMGICLFFIYDWFKKKQKQKELEKQNLESELQLLKNQLSPHFLFNSLNNIDSLIHSDPDKASVSLIQLSGMMRYMLYETNTSEILLVKEIAHIESYLILQKLQYGNPDLVSFRVSGNPEGIRIAPMLLMPFVENAFKHCTDKQQADCIRLCLKIEGMAVSFEVSNICRKVEKIHKDSSSGIGLNTVRRRLEYLYPNQYELSINEKNDLFCVSVLIRLV